MSLDARPRRLYRPADKAAQHKSHAGTGYRPPHAVVTHRGLFLLRLSKRRLQLYPPWHAGTRHQGKDHAASVVAGDLSGIGQIRDRTHSGASKRRSTGVSLETGTADGTSRSGRPIVYHRPRLLAITHPARAQHWQLRIRLDTLRCCRAYRIWPANQRRGQSPRITLDRARESTTHDVVLRGDGCVHGGWVS